MWIAACTRKYLIKAVKAGMTDPADENLTPLAHAAQNRCFGCGRANAVGLRLDFFLSEDKRVVCLPQVPDSYEGPPGYVHGGIIATLLDEAMSKAVRSHGLVAMTRHMEVDYRRPVKSGTPLRLEGSLTNSQGRKHWTEARILDAAGVTLATGKGLFVEVATNQGGTTPTPVGRG
ncbi:PaaI family thioesterase [Acidobacteria bacterium AB60]|nr:PaaI family thioesterase [Acidobacteria bacterium AB60]